MRKTKRSIEDRVSQYLQDTELSYSRIGKICGISSATICRIKRELGIDRPRKSSEAIAETTRKKVTQLFQNTSLSQSEIAEFLGINRGSVFYIVKKCRLKRLSIRRKNSKVKCKWCEISFYPRSGKNRPNRNKFCSKECYRQWQMTDENRGPNHPNWKPDAVHEPDRHSVRHRAEWKEWREKIYKRDNYTCQLCLARGGRLEPHHILPRRDYGDRIFDISNGVTLCRKCHKGVTHKEYEYVKYFEAMMIHTPFR